MNQGEDLSDTEQLVLSYLQSHTPEECMLDKISLGIGKSRATVLKYLGMLYAKQILDYRIIGRNKLWQVRSSPGVNNTATRDRIEPPSSEIRTLVDHAFKLHDLCLREADLADRLDLPEMIVLTVTDGLTIVAQNRLFISLFPDAGSLKDLISPSQAGRIEGIIGSKMAKDGVSLDLDLMEMAGVYRPYQCTIFPPGTGDPAGCRVIVGEDLSGKKRTRRNLEALLYIIRAAGNAENQEQLLIGVMQGVREKLIRYVDAAIIMADMPPVFSTFEFSDDTRDLLSPLIRRSLSTLETVSWGRNEFPDHLVRADEGASSLVGIVAVPIIEDEESTGVILLFLDSDVSSMDIENIEIIADEIANVQKMLRLDQERSEYINTLLAMNRISGILNDTRDEGSILELSIESVMDSLGFEMGCVYLRDEENTMIPKVHRNMPENLRNMCLSGIFTGLFERAFTERHVIYIRSDMPEYSRLDPAVMASGVRTLLMLPIKSGDHVIGLLNMGSRDEKRYQNLSLENLSSIGLQLGVALDRFRLGLALKERSQVAKEEE